ncbi:MAG: NUDIX domain-containing protein [Clostridiales bacterium]|nr:NUDIX domain-containing protein [Clostridiales bacterium]
MLGGFAKVKITHKIGFIDEETGFRLPLNFGRVCDDSACTGAFVMGVMHPVKNFSGRVIAVLRRRGGKDRALPHFLQEMAEILIVAPKNTRYIIIDILKFIDTNNYFKNYSINCLYESSCGAVVFRKIKGETRFLLIKNKRSSNWGFPKGHIENGETRQDTARREVLEETGVHVDFIDGYERVSKYKIQNKIEKNVHIFIGSTKDSETKIQAEEIDDYMWLPYSRAMRLLKFENDKKIMASAYKFLTKNNYI